MECNLFIIESVRPFDVIYSVLLLFILYLM